MASGTARTAEAWPSTAVEEAFRKSIAEGLRSGVIAPINDGFRILPENWMTSDAIIASLMIDHNDED